MQSIKTAPKHLLEDNIKILADELSCVNRYHAQAARIPGFSQPDLLDTGVEATPFNGKRNANLLNPNAFAIRKKRTGKSTLKEEKLELKMLPFFFSDKQIELEKDREESFSIIDGEKQLIYFQIEVETCVAVQFGWLSRCHLHLHRLPVQVPVAGQPSRELQHPQVPPD
jgi:hypothetical protein